MRRVIALLLLASCGGDLDGPLPAPQDCATVPTVVLDCGNATSECPDIAVPEEGCRAWNGVATIGFCVRECAR